MRDWRGTVVEVGTVIVYPQRHGSALWVVEAQVDEIGERELDDGKVIPFIRATAMDATWTHRIAARKVILTALDRVTVVRPRVGSGTQQEPYCGLCHQFHDREECF